MLLEPHQQGRSCVSSRWFRDYRDGSLDPTKYIVYMCIISPPKISPPQPTPGPKEGHSPRNLGHFRRGFRFASFFVWKDSDPAGRCSMYTRPTWKMYIWLHLPPTKFKAMLPSNSHGQQGEASSAVESTAESPCGGLMALPAPIPSGRTKEPSARNASSSSTAHEAARARSDSHAVR